MRTLVAAVAATAPMDATAEGWLGLYPARDFRITDGTCSVCPPIPSARWYFERETIAVPLDGLPVAAYSTGVTAFDDVRAWRAAHAPDAPIDYPPLVWIAAPQVVRGARLDPDGSSLSLGRERLAIALTPKIALNRSYFDASSTRFFSARTVSARGVRHDGGPFVVRTFWPDDWRLREAPSARVAMGEAPARDAAPVDARRAARRRTQSVRRVHRLAEGRRAVRLERQGGSGVHRQRRAGRRRRSARRTLRHRNRSHRKPTARSATGWSTTSTRSMRRAKRGSSPLRCRSTPISRT